MTAEDKAALVTMLITALRESGHLLSDEEGRYVRLLIKKEEQAAEVRQAIIKHTLSGLVWSAILGLGYLILDFARSHGLKL